jgi:hypothetical protein
MTRRRHPGNIGAKGELDSIEFCKESCSFLGTLLNDTAAFVKVELLHRMSRLHGDQRFTEKNSSMKRTTTDTVRKWLYFSNYKSNMLPGTGSRKQVSNCSFLFRFI